jgi:hypothetical protein
MMHFCNEMIKMYVHSCFAGTAALKPEAIVHQHPTHCLNCGAGAKANFCQYCGQETVLHVPSAREFLHEFVGHYVALEGKLWKSLALLLFKPGKLTHDYIEGRRARYVLPLRLYLTFSIVFFALFKYGGHDASNINIGSGKARTEVHAKDEQTDKEKLRQELAIVKEDPQVRGVVAAIASKLGKKVEKFKDMQTEELERNFKASFFGNVPYAIFALMPLFALFLKVLYLGSGRRYGEHLLFALHTNAFAFLMLSILLILPKEIPLLGAALGLWLVFYLPAAMRKVYGGTRWATALRWIVLMTLHLSSMILAIAGAMAVGMGLVTVT